VIHIYLFFITDKKIKIYYETKFHEDGIVNGDCMMKCLCNTFMINFHDIEIMLK